MGLFNRNKKDNTPNNTASYDEIQRLYMESMKALNQAMTIEDKEKAVELANNNWQKMINMGYDRENKMFATLNAEVEKARRELDGAISKHEASAQELEDRLQKVDNNSHRESISSTVSDTAKQALQDMFNRQYEKIINVQYSLINGEYHDEFYTKEINSIERRFLLLPLFIEKKAVVGLSKCEEEILKNMELLLMAYTGGKMKEGYTSAVGNLQALGLIDIRDEACFMQTFDNNVKDDSGV